MTPDEIARVRSSWHAIEPNRDAFGLSFYARLFQQAPATRDMFKRDLAAQSVKLMATLHVVVEYLDKLDEVLPTVRQLGARHHQEWQVSAEQYDWVRDALIWTLEQHLGETFDAQLRQAWLLAYDAVAEPMKLASNTARPHRP